MSLDPKKSTFDSKPRVNPPVGKQTARNYAIIDIGTQTESFEGKAPKQTPKVMFLFEFPKSLHVFKEEVGPEPLEVSQEYSYIASDRSKLCKVLKVWGNLPKSPTELNLKPYLGQYCEIDIEYKPKKDNPEIIYANIADGGRGVSRHPETFTNPVDNSIIRLIDPVTRIPIGCKAYNKDFWFDLDHFNWAQFKEIPKFIQDKIKLSAEWSGILQKYGQEPQVTQPVINANISNYAATPKVTEVAAPIVITGEVNF